MRTPEVISQHHTRGGTSLQQVALPSKRNRMNTEAAAVAQGHLFTV